MSISKNFFLSALLLCILQEILLGQNTGFQSKIINKGNVYYLSNVIHIRLINESSTIQKRAELNQSLKARLSPYGIQTVTRTFNNNSKELSSILTIQYNSPEDPLVVCSKLSGMPDILWAEPHYVHKAYFIPDDPQFSTQWNLDKIQAEAAWNIVPGDSSVIIAIVDTGVDWTHPDLSANIWINKKEIPNNGIDDDHNGYVDDVRGWDFGGATGTPDNDPNEDFPAHGTHVAGIASAVTNNKIGIASIGFNCKLMAVKTSIGNDKDSQGEPFVVYGFEGIIYAADNGARIINCSWGGVSFSNLEQQVINYAVSKGSLIVAAAGNSNNEDPQYPSDYNGVLSVASVGMNDIRSSFSSFGQLVDVSAPGEAIYSTWKGGGYQVEQGTSMSSPMAAGLAGLVASRFPNFTPLQIGEQIRVNTDNIDNLNPSVYANKIGSGRINAAKALSNTNSKSVRAVNVSFSNNTAEGNNGVFESGETIDVALKFINYLNPVNNLTVTLESKNNYSTLLNSSFTIGTVASMDSFSNASNVFQFRINNNTPDNSVLAFLLKYSSGDYSDYQWISVLVNPTFKTQSTNQLELTLTSKGALGYNDYPTNKYGLGFRFKGSTSLLFEGAFMFGNSAARVSDAARLGGNSGQSTDFHMVRRLIINSPGEKADQQGFTSFSDSGAPQQSRFNILTEQYSYSYNDPPNNNFIILRYRMINESASQITNLFAGLFLDWDMIEGSGQGDVVKYNKDNNFGYAYHDTVNTNLFVGCALLSKGNYNQYGILNSGADGDINLDNSFTDAEKWKTLSSGLIKTNSGPGDISMVSSGGPFILNSHDTLSVAFALAAGSSFEELLQAIQLSREKYHLIDTTTVVNSVPVAYKLDNNYPNPFNSATIITYELPHKTAVQLKVYDLLGKEIATLVNTEQEANRYVVKYHPKILSSGVYFYRLSTSDFTMVKKMVYIK